MEPTENPAPGTLGRRSLLLAQAFVALWGVAFIARTSFVASDGVRRYTLADDAMISMRYAWNLAHSQGLVWNAGERVEGYTNLLQTLLMAFFCRAFDSVHAVLAVQIAGLLTCVGTLAALRAVVMRSGGDASSLTSSLLLTATCYSFLFWPLLGMETGLLALLVTWAAALLLPGAEPGAGWPRAVALGLVLGLATLARADGAVVAAALLVAGLPGSRLRLPQAVTSVALIALALAGQALFRWTYYGDLVPNTVRLKVYGMPALVRAHNGLAYLHGFAVAAAPLLVAFTVAVRRRRRRGAQAAGGVLAATLLYVLLAGGDAFDHWRFLVPVLPLTIAVASGELTRLGRWFSGRAAPPGRRGWLAAPAAVLPAGLVGLVLNFGALRQMVLLAPPPEREVSQTHVELYLTLDEVLADGATLGVLYAGTLPYYGSRWRCVDFLGKSDRRVAGLPPWYLPGRPSLFRLRYQPGHNKFDLRYSILERHPTFIETFSWRNQNLYKQVRGLYVWGRLGSSLLLLLRDDPAVRWERLEEVRPL